MKKIRQFLISLLLTKGEKYVILRSLQERKSMLEREWTTKKWDLVQNYEEDIPMINDLKEICKTDYWK